MFIKRYVRKLLIYPNEDIYGNCPNEDIRTTQTSVKNMSLINPLYVHSDIEKKITTFLSTQLTDRRSVGRPNNSPFVVIGSELQHSHRFPHVIVQLTDMPDDLFAMGSKHRIKYPLVQITMWDSNKKSLNELKDECLYDMANGRATWLSWGLSRCKVRSEGYMAYNRELKVHGYFIQYEFLYFHIIT